MNFPIIPMTNSTPGSSSMNRNASRYCSPVSASGAGDADFCGIAAIRTGSCRSWPIIRMNGTLCPTSSGSRARTAR